MHIIGISGSPRGRKSNTRRLVERVLAALAVIIVSWYKEREVLSHDPVKLVQKLAVAHASASAQERRTASGVRGSRFPHSSARSTQRGRK